MNACQLVKELWELRQVERWLGAKFGPSMYVPAIKHWSYWPFKTVRRRVVWEQHRTLATIRVGREGVRISGAPDDVAKWVQVALDLLDAC